MKHLISTILFLLLVITSQAQQFNEEGINTLADKVCEQLTKDDINASEQGPGEAEAYFEKTVVNVVMKNYRLFKSKGLDINEQNGEAIGEEMAIVLMANCPKAAELFTTMAIESMDEEEDHSESGVVVGTVVSISSDMIPVITVRESNGNIVKILWLSTVENYHLLYDAATDGKKYQFTIYEATIYDGRIQEYRDMNVLEMVQGI
ncbi:hypothetical protein BST91_05270 [Nonlabens tegetincola]|uniref:hypothetical protein n=1 Tax=Nonlabens tegetincola TaxID=323273 RepID=UPI000A204E41|nr:hypothetical protein [Nonlabens tegetincola]ARN71101.1 hypothetical protein BST91_05270 [Nonlabens tegetincola]